jgi:hypothetical protein
MSAPELDSMSSSSDSVTAYDSPPLLPSSSSRGDGHPVRYASQRSSSSTARPSQPSYLPHDRHGLSSISPEARRESMIAMDRKRRLTGSHYMHEQPRRRQNPSDFFTRSESIDSNDPSRSSPSSSPPLPPPRDVSNQPPIVDLTGSPSPPAPPPRSPPRVNIPRRTSSNSSRRYVVPAWQPDSEVSQCPICKKQFTWMFRRHHCRKCGRVVCDGCSPHRITIPRQFIVNPPRPDSSSSQDQVETIDLTGDDSQEFETQDRRFSRDMSTAGLEGGEKVRLCNPCVPDPQPGPLPSYLPSSEDRNTSSFVPRSLGALYQQPGPVYTNILGQQRRASGHHTPLSQSVGGMPTGRLDHSSSLGARPRPPSITNPYSAHLPHPPSAGLSNTFAAGRAHDVSLTIQYLVDCTDTVADVSSTYCGIEPLSACITRTQPVRLLGHP